MVQIIEENRKPTFAQKLNQGIGQGLEGGMQLYQQYQQQQAQEKQHEQENEAAARMGIDLRGIRDPKIREKAFELMGQQQNQESLEKLKFQNQSKLQGQKLAGKEGEGAKAKATAQNSFNGLADILNSGEVGFGSSLLSNFSKSSAEATGKFQSLLGGIESTLVHLVNTGALSDARFKYITETLLPKSTDYDDVIRGKLEGIAEILGLDSSALSKKGKSKDQEKKSLEDIFG